MSVRSLHPPVWYSAPRTMQQVVHAVEVTSQMDLTSSPLELAALVVLAWPRASLGVDHTTWCVLLQLLDMQVFRTWETRAT